MLKQTIERINELARKSRTEQGLTDEEKQEQAKLRREYIDATIGNTRAQLDSIKIVDEKGNVKPLKEKSNDK